MGRWAPAFFYKTAALIVANPFAQGVPAHLPFQRIGATWS
jgi:uncharacterized protein YbbC (DUF1343 family)